MRKKDIHFLKTKKFLENYPIIVFLHHNNLKVNDWAELKISLNAITPQTLENNIISKENNVFLFKNNIMKKVLLSLSLTNSNTQSLSYMFQGPSFAFGCKDLSQLKILWNKLKSIPNVIILGGICSNIVLNHLDLEKYLNLNDTQVFSNLILNLDVSNFYSTLKKIPNFQILNQVQLNLITCLLHLQNNK